MVRKVVRGLAFVILVSGIICLVSPGMMEIFFQYEVHIAIKEYEAWMEENTLLDQLYERMQAYNRELYQNKQKDLVEPFSYQQLDISVAPYGLFNEMIGYVEIPKIQVRLPIYLGAHDMHMSKGAAHLTKTSFPIGGVNTNAVLAAHRGFVRAAMFRDIEKIQVGDEIIIKNFREELRYRVTETTIIRPSEIERILIQDNEDMVTLITCHPYRQSYQRYIVYAKRSRNN